MIDEGIFERLNIKKEELPAKLEFVKGSNGHSRTLRFLVTGGCGYFGYELSKAIHGVGGHVTMFDLQIPSRIKNILDKSLVFIKGDVCDYESVIKAFQGIDCVFHVASFGMTGKDQLNKMKTYNVNVLGTKNVINGCREARISKLIYTSSYNVAFGKNPIENGDDFVPYAPKEEMVDCYSKTKQDADKLVLVANGTKLKGGGTLHTCCLRPAGIYGPHEKRHLHRVAKMIKRGYVLFNIGSVPVDWVHINNLVQAHLLAIPGLSKASNRIAAGQAYFIADNNPIEVMEFLKPVFYACGKTPPRYKLPATITYFFGFLMELLHHIMRPVCCFEPLLTRNEVLKMTIPHYQSMQRVMEELGYKPRKYEFAGVVKIYMKENYPELDRRYSVYGDHLDTASRFEYSSKFCFLLTVIVLFITYLFILF